MTSPGRSVHRALLVLSFCAAFAVPAAAETFVIARTPLPPTIRIAEELRTHVDAMLLASPTFRQQFERIINAPKLILDARVDMTIMQRPFRARSCIRRYESGLLVVSMDIGPGSGQAEWIAHEFEHVIEQLDGVRLPLLAERPQPGIWFSGGGMVETQRATRAGRVVMDEMRTGREHMAAGREASDKFVE